VPAPDDPDFHSRGRIQQSMFPGIGQHQSRSTLETLGANQGPAFGRSATQGDTSLSRVRVAFAITAGARSKNVLLVRPPNSPVRKNIPPLFAGSSAFFSPKDPQGPSVKLGKTRRIKSSRRCATQKNKRKRRDGRPFQIYFMAGIVGACAKPKNAGFCRGICFPAWPRICVLPVPAPHEFGAAHL